MTEQHCTVTTVSATDESGVTAREHAPLGALIAAVNVTGIGVLGNQVVAPYDWVSNDVSTAVN